MITMRIVFTLIVAVVGSLSYGQTIAEYYLPSLGNNKSNFFTPHPKTGEKTPLTSSMWYIRKGDNTYEVMEAKFHNGEATSIQTHTIKFSDNEIKLLKSISTGILRERTEQIYSPPQTLLKLPTQAEKSSWATKGSNNSTSKCSGELITVKVDGQQKKVLKVKREKFENGQFVDWATTFEYYVVGMGLWKIQTPSGEIMDQLENQEYDENVSKF